VLLFVVGSGAVLAGPPAPAHAQVVGPCPVTFNGVEADRIDSLSSPLLLRDDEALSFAGIDALGTQNARVAVILGPARLGRASASFPAPTGEFEVSLSLADVAPYGVGLLRVRGTTDNCAADVWLRLGGRAPFTTLLGLTGSGLAAAGLIAQISALLARRRWSLPVAAAAGAATGAGSALLGQELGRLQLSYPTLGATIALAVIAGFGLALLRRPRKDRRAKRDDDEAPSPTAPERRWEAPPVPASSPAAAVAAPVPETRPTPSTRPAAAGPFWSYVMADVEVLDLEDYSRVVAVLRPGSWYLAKREVSGWAQVVAADGTEGWVPRQALHREG